MIGYLSGKVIDYYDGTVILETGGVGFEVACSASAYKMLVERGAGEIFVYTAVKEDGISLYGFSDGEEKRVFLRLISVSGVGPKMGIAILSGISMKDLITAIARGDVKTLSAVKGLGKKTAERIILELREKVDGDNEAFIASLTPTASAVKDPEFADAVDALIGLGFSKTESEKAVSEAQRNGKKTAQELISYAIKIVR